MTPETRALLDAVQAQLDAGEERLASAHAIIDAEGLFALVDDDDDENQHDYAPEWAEPLAEPFFIPQGRNELDALFDEIDDSIDALFDEIEE